MNKPFVPPTTPWGAPRGGLAPTPLMAFDPRLDISDDALVLASKNAYPVIAKHKVKSDKFGMIAGASVALMLGAITFASMNSGRTEEPVSSSALVPAKVDPVPLPRPAVLPPGAGMQMQEPVGMTDQPPAMTSAPSGQAVSITPVIHGSGGMTSASSPAVVFDVSVGRGTDQAGRPATLIDGEARHC